MYGYCIGIVLDKNYKEVACNKRDGCRYYDEMFYVRNKGRLREFEMLDVQMSECGYFISRD